MSEVAPPVRRRLSDDAIEHLHSLMAGWQLIADLAFADLLLFLAVEGSESFRIVGQLRPYTARTLYPADLVGEVVEPTWHPYVERAWREGRRQRSLEPILIDAEPVRVETVPVRHQGEIVAVLSVESPETPARPTGRLEASYLGAAGALLEMVAAGTFPFVEAHDPTASPRVGDGLVVLDASGRVEFASPNATSAFRRMGTNALPIGQPLPHRAAILVAEAMAGGRPVESEIEAAGAVTDVRVVPLLRDAGNRGALVLVREATELRRLGRVISRREATIREVHHRVKNNLQTVASLLRLQARRLGDHPQAVAALEDSVRRITSIALVHETLTEEFEGAVDMADVARRVVRMLEGSLGRDDVHIELHTASVRVDAAVATPLAVVLNELIQNAVEHGLGDGPGTVTVQLRGGDDRPVELQVHDNGAGAPTPPAPGGSEPHPPPGGSEPHPAPGESEPHPPPGAPEPHLPEAGAPEREGSPAAERGRPAVHSPRGPAAHSPGGTGFPAAHGPGGTGFSGASSPGGTGFSGVHSLEGGLGLRLVRALVEEELRGQFTLTNPAGRGSIATAVIPPVERAG
ncbi:MAG TPA: histidine kinase N-terminal domain-containing protein [Actinomycetota bacterium]|jgi:two-component sensor histidine kinase|nr:histidine kinase N-terminal domain-containing protein [Actinomycetota bacterium]